MKPMQRTRFGYVAATPVSSAGVIVFDPKRGLETVCDRIVIEAQSKI